MHVIKAVIDLLNLHKDTHLYKLYFLYLICLSVHVGIIDRRNKRINQIEFQSDWVLMLNLQYNHWNIFKNRKIKLVVSVEFYLVELSFIVILFLKWNECWPPAPPLRRKMFLVCEYIWSNINTFYFGQFFFSALNINSSELYDTVASIA